MKQKSFIKRDASGKPFVEQQPKVTLTPEQKLKSQLLTQEFDKKLKEAFKDGVDLSGQATP